MHDDMIIEERIAYQANHFCKVKKCRSSFRALLSFLNELFTGNAVVMVTCHVADDRTYSPMIEHLFDTAVLSSTDT